MAVEGLKSVTELWGGSRERACFGLGSTNYLYPYPTDIEIKSLTLFIFWVISDVHVLVNVLRDGAFRTDIIRRRAYCSKMEDYLFRARVFHVFFIMYLLKRKFDLKLHVMIFSFYKVL